MDGCWLAGRREGANTNPVPVVERRRGEKGREGPSERASRKIGDGGRDSGCRQHRRRLLLEDSKLQRWQ